MTVGVFRNAGAIRRGMNADKSTWKTITQRPTGAALGIRSVDQISGGLSHHYEDYIDRTGLQSRVFFVSRRQFGFRCR